MVHSDKEFSILNKLSEKSSISQRELAKSLGVSLGLINLILKKLIRVGYIQVLQLNKKKLAYLLTPTGLKETTRRSRNYAMSTIRTYNQIRADLVRLLQGLHHSGYEYFSIHGDGELKDLLVSAFENGLEDVPVRLGKEHLRHSRAVVLNLTEEPLPSDVQGDSVNVIERIRSFP